MSRVLTFVPIAATSCVTRLSRSSFHASRPSFHASRSPFQSLSVFLTPGSSLSATLSVNMKSSSASLVTIASRRSGVMESRSAAFSPTLETKVLCPFSALMISPWHSASQRDVASSSMQSRICRWHVEPQ